MIKRGIFNTKADWWVHFFPLEYMIYSYYVADMREWIEEENPPITPGRSKDGTVTGQGILAPRNLPFVIQKATPKDIVDHFDWANGTDREVGLLWGEKAIRWMLTRNSLAIPYFTVRPLRKKSEQFTLGDYAIQFRMPEVLVAEVKTEKVKSGNLYVQTYEKGHKVHQAKKGGAIINRLSEAPGFD